MDSSYETSINFAALKLGIEPVKLHDEQKRIMYGLLSKRDVLVGLPTGYGKSFIFQAAPIAADHLAKMSLGPRLGQTLDFGPEGDEEHSQDRQSSDGASSIAIIISPLTSLIKDQVTFLNSKGMKAIHFGEGCTSDEKEDIESGSYNYVFMSPEQLLSHDGIFLIKKSSFHKQVCGIFVDESHCIVKWGIGSAKVKAFRAYYGKLHQVRSYLPAAVPIVALTATASLAARKLIEDKLNLRDPLAVLKSPEKSNIRYSQLTTNREQDIQSLFRGITEELSEKKENMERIIVYCRSHRHCREMYSHITYDHPELKNLVAMFHSTTEESVKERVVSSFGEETGEVRLLFATIAFGMGVDVKGVYNVVHIGPPADLDDYLQESGRAGRDGTQSYAILINYSGSSGRFQTSEQMKEYVQSTSKCRREMILNPFGYAPSREDARPLHLCCDVCATQCTCGDSRCGEESQGRGFVETKLREQLAQAETKESKEILREISEENVALLHKELLDLREDQLRSSSCMPSKSITGDDIASGLPLSTIDNIMDNLSYITDSCFLEQNFVLLNPQLAREVMALISKNSTLLSEAAVLLPVSESRLTASYEDSDSEGSISDLFRELQLIHDSSDD